MTDNEELLSREELASALKTTRQTVAKWEEEGIIGPAFRVGSIRRYRYSDVLEQLAAHNVEEVE